MAVFALHVMKHSGISRSNHSNYILGHHKILAGSKVSTTKVFHYFTCGFTRKIKNDNARYFKTRGEALKKGYETCNACKPQPDYSQRCHRLTLSCHIF